MEGHFLTGVTDGDLLARASATMEEGTKTKKTIFVGGIGDDVDESTIYETFFPFGTSHGRVEIASKFT